MKCGTDSCAAEAAVEVFWPGKTLPMCVPCAERAWAVAEAMGFELEIRPVVIVDGKAVRP